MERRFERSRIEEPTPEEAVEILIALRERMEGHHGVTLDDEALRAAVERSVGYLPDFRLPDKALDGVDLVCAAVRVRTLTQKKRRDWKSQPRTQEKRRDWKSQPRTQEKRRDRLSLPLAGTGSPSHNVSQMRVGRGPPVT
ncbi:MAG: hypothetical protein WED15_09075 [Akkermansiaceae bacterium]